MHGINLPKLPGVIIGHTSRGPIRLQAGGDGQGDGGQGDGAGQSGGQTGGQTAGQGQGQQAGQGTGQGDSGQQQGQQPGQQGQGQGGQQPADGDVESLPEWAQKIIRDARQDAGKARTNAKQQAADEARNDLAQQIGKALGLVKNDEPADPAKLTEQLTSEQSAKRDALVRVTLHEDAAQHGGDAKALSDSRSFLEQVSNLDPTADDFRSKVTEAAKKAVADNPRLKAAGQAPPRSGSDFTGGSGEKQKTDRPKNLADAFSRRYNNAG